MSPGLIEEEVTFRKFWIPWYSHKSPSRPIVKVFKCADFGWVVPTLCLHRSRFEEVLGFKSMLYRLKSQVSPCKWLPATLLTSSDISMILETRVDSHVQPIFAAGLSPLAF